MDPPAAGQPKGGPPVPPDPTPTVGEAGPVRPGPVFDFLQSPSRPGSLGRLGHYEVLEVLGRGGFGIVFRAFDERLQRVVAVKVLAPELAASPPARARFLREARAAAQARHENVVQTYAVEEDPLPYLVMEFVPGETLQQRLDRTGPLEAAEVAAVGRQIAEGLAAAHAVGLIHRDVKPGNILLESGPRLRVKVTDFGLARAADDASVTQSGVVVGTPMYMSPEQARGDRLDQRSDLFSLGSVLYTMIAGRPPFRAGNSLAVLKRVAEAEPQPIPEIAPQTPAWLCRVIAKLMAKDPDRRFQTAQEVGLVLEAGLTSPETVALAGRQPSRRPSLRKLLLAGSVPAFVCVLAVTAYRLRRDAGPEAGGVRLPTPEELAARPSAADALRRENLPRDLLAAVPKEVAAVLGEASWFHYPGKATNRTQARMSKDGKLLAAPSGMDGKLDLFDATTGAHLCAFDGPRDSVRSIAFSPEGDLLAACAGHGAKQDLRVWDLRRNKVLFTFTDQVGHPFFSPDGKWVGSFKNGAMIQEARSGKVVKHLEGVGFEGPFGEFSPDGKLLAALKGQTEVVVFDTDTWQALHTLKCAEEDNPVVHFSPEGGLLAVGSNRGLHVWKTDDFKKLRHLEIPIYDHAFDFFPDGRTIIARSTFAFLPAHTYVRWDVTTGENKGEFSVASPEPDYQYFSLSPDGKDLLVVDYKWGPRVRVFDPQTGEERHGPTRHDGKVLAVAVSPNGETLASAGAGADTRVRLWDLATGKLLRALPPRPQPQATVAFSPDGKTLASGSLNSGEITFWDWQSGQEAGALTGQGRTIAQLAFSPDGKTLAFRTASGETKLCELATKKLRVIDPGGFEGEGCVAFSPDGRTLATGGADAPLRLYDVGTGAEVGSLGGSEEAIRWAAFRPDGRSVAFCGGARDRLIRHWDIAPPAERPALRGHTSGVLACAWRADGKLLVSAGERDGMVRLWDPDARPPQSRALVLFAPGQGSISCIALTPEGRHLVTGNADGTLYVLRLAGPGEVLRAP